MDNTYNILKNNLKRERKCSATNLPDGITQDMIPKYVVYHKECYNKERQLFRDYFKIDKHPKIDNNKYYCSSKSNKVSPLEKLLHIKKILQEIENKNGSDIDQDISNNKQNIYLPKYISIKNIENNKINLVYDKKIGDKRYTFRKIYNNDKYLSDILKDFENIINEICIKT